MAGDQWTHLSARFEQWWDETLVADPAVVETQDNADAGPLVLIVAADVTADRVDGRLDFCVTYDSLPHSRYSKAEFIGDRWRATRRDGTQLEGLRGGEQEFAEAGVAFLLDPQAILDRGEVLDEHLEAGGRRHLRLREPQEPTATLSSGEVVDFGKPQGHWRLIADDVAFHGADAYVAVQDVTTGLLLRWDALRGDRLLRRFQLDNVELTESRAE